MILAIGPAAIRAARDATSTIPIVALDLESDPVQAGFARSLAQPGGNITGCFLDQPGLTGKWLELIGEAVPGTRRIAVLVDPTTGPWQLAAIKAAAEKLRIELQVLEIRSSGELDHALEAAIKGGSRALVQLSSPLFDCPARQTDRGLHGEAPPAGDFHVQEIRGGRRAHGLRAEPAGVPQAPGRLHRQDPQGREARRLSPSSSRRSSTSSSTSRPPRRLASRSRHRS